MGEIIILRATITHHPLNISTRTRIVNVVGRLLKRGESAKPRKRRGSTKPKRNVQLRKTVRSGIVKKAKDLKLRRKGKYEKRRNARKKKKSTEKKAADQKRKRKGE